MANHLTPTELAREAGMDRREVISKCMEMGVPIFQGRIDKTLFLASIKQASQGRRLRSQKPEPLPIGAVRPHLAGCGPSALIGVESLGCERRASSARLSPDRG